MNDREPGLLLVREESGRHGPGGIAMVVETLARECAPSREVALFLAASWDETALTMAREEAWTVYSQRLRGLLDPRWPVRALLGGLAELPATLLTLRRILRRHGIGLIHLHTPSSDFFPFRLLTLLGGPPCLVTLHGSDVVSLARMDPRERRLRLWLLQGATRVTAVSAPLAREAAALLGRPVLAIDNGIALDALPPPDPDPSLPADFLLVIGPLATRKGPQVALEAYARIAGEWPGLQLIFAGADAGAMATLQARADEPGLRGRVRFPGALPHDRLLALLGRARLLVAPSPREGFGLVLLEAGAMGVPVLATAIPTFRHILEDGRHGLLFPADDVPALAGGMARLLADPGLGRHLAASLSERVRRDFTARAMAERYRALYREILSPAPDAVSPRP